MNQIMARHSYCHINSTRNEKCFQEIRKSVSMKCVMMKDDKNLKCEKLKGQRKMNGQKDIQG